MSVFSPRLSRPENHFIQTKATTEVMFHSPILSLASIPSLEEVRQARQAKGNQLPLINAQKRERLHGTVEEQTELAELISHRRELLKDSIISSKKTMSVAKWLPDRRLAEVTTQKGSMFEVMGHCEKGVMLLEGEEALFMLETGLLELFHEDLPMSLQQGYHLLLSEEFPLHHYQVYAFLIREGYVVFRHRRHSRFTSERRDAQSVEKKDSTNVSMTCAAADLQSGSTCVEEGTRCVLDGIHETGSSVEITDRSATAYSHPADVLENVYQAMLRGERLFYGSGQQSDVADGRISSTGHEPSYPIHTPSQNACQETASVQTARRDSDYMSTDVVDKSPCPLQTPVPTLLSPGQILEKGELLHRLNIFSDHKQVVRHEGSLESADDSSIILDVHQHCGVFRKSSRQRPDFYICVAKLASHAPSRSEIINLQSFANSIPVRWAIVEDDKISFYSLEGTSLPEL